MSYRSLAILPLLLAAALAVAAGSSTDPDTRAVVLRAGIELAKSLALAGCAIAAFAFARGDYLRAAWLLNGVTYLFLLIRDVTLIPKITASLGGATPFVHGALVVIGNAAGVVGIWMMARAWRVAGLTLAGSPRSRTAAQLLALAVAVLLAGAPFAGDLRLLLGGDVEAVVPLASDIGDAASLVLLAPVALTALTVWRGVLRWPWALLSASLLGWLFYDAAAALERLKIGLDPAGARILAEGFRVLACSYLFSAGLAQRAAVTSEHGAS